MRLTRPGTGRRIRSKSQPNPGLHGFRPEFLDFNKGIRVGNLEPQERITQILKRGLEGRYKQPFVVDRWGRGVFWQWICFVPKANRSAKPVSRSSNFGCSKFFISIDRKEPAFQCGFQVERGYLVPDSSPAPVLCDDWDWHRLLSEIASGKKFLRGLKHLSEDGFQIFAGSFEMGRLTKSESLSKESLLAALGSAKPDEWAGFQLYYSMNPEEVKQSSGPDLVDSMMAIFQEVAPLMNCCMQVALPIECL